MDVDQRDPFWQLWQIAAQSVGTVVLPALISKPKDSWNGLGYRLGDSIFVSPLHEIREIISYPKLRKIPGVVEWFKGIATSHGELLAISDIQAMLTGQLQNITPNTRVLVVPWAGQLSGFLVSGIEGLQEYGTEDPATAPIQSVYRKYLRGLSNFDGRTWLQLGLRQVAASSEFKRIAVLR